MIEMPDKGELQAATAPVLTAARCLVITDKPSHGTGMNLLKTLACAERTVKSKLNPIVDTAHKAHAMLTALRKELLDPITEAKGIVSGKLMEYEEAAKAAAEEEARLLAEQERKAEEERRLQAATDAESRGDKAGAEAILNEQPAEVVVHVDAEVAAVEGVGKTYEVWSAEVTDLEALVAHGVVEYLLPNTVALNAIARAMKGGLKIPGVRAVCKTTRAVRG
jgi:hypothetical protein